MIVVPEFIDILLETESEVCNRIADLCNDRTRLEYGYTQAFAQCRDLDQMVALELERKERLEAIDREVIVRSRALKKLGDQIRVTS